MSSLLARELFGHPGEVFHQLTDALAPKVIGVEYHFMEEPEFGHLIARSHGEAMRVYWTEMLFRAHWAAASNILRHKRWHDACLKLYAPHANFLGFTACLRGLLEASADAYYSLSAIPLTLATFHASIEQSLSGRATTITVSKELEDMLIHFHFARGIAKGETVPEGHKAAQPSKYLRTADGIGRTNIKDLYAELCQVVHPAAQSVLWMTAGSGEDIVLTAGDDEKWIWNLCKKHAEAIESAHMQSINTCILILKVLNRFPLRHLWTEFVNSVQMDSVPAWSKIDRLFAR